MGACSGPRGVSARKRARPSACMNLPSANIGAARRFARVRHGPGRGLPVDVLAGGDVGPGAEVERAPPGVGMRGEAHVLAEDLVRRHEIESGEPHGARHLADDPPVRARLAGRPAGMAAGARCVRSELVTMPSFSPQASAGSSTCASAAVSVLRITSDTTTSSQLRSACLHLVGVRQANHRIGRHDPHRLDAAVVDALEHLHGLRALARRRWSGLPQNCCTAARPAASSMSMCAASVLAKPPTSRPPMALGWPVTENGPAPGLPMRPVAR